MLPCEHTDYFMTYNHFRMMPSSIHGQPIEDHHGDEIQRQLLNATEPLVNSLLTNTKFLQSLTNHGSGRLGQEKKYLCSR